MRGEIIKIHFKNQSRNGDGQLVTVIIKLENGITTETHLVSSYRNFKRWTPLLREGNRLEGLEMKGNLINADSWAKEYHEPEQGEWVQTPAGTMAWIIKNKNKIYEQVSKNVEALPAQAKLF